MPMYEGISITSDKQAVVIDLGTAYTKFGYASDPAPRCIIPSKIQCPNTKQEQQLYSFANSGELYQLLVTYLHNLYFKHLLVSPKDRRVVIVESLLSTTIFRETLAKVLFNHFEVASLLFAPSHLVAPYTLGVRTALVLDIGYQEAVLIPVFEGIPILHAWQAQPLAAHAIHSNLRSLLIKNQDTSKHYLSRVLEDLPESTIEDMKVRTCFVTTHERAQKLEQNDPLPPPPGVEYRTSGNILINISGVVRENTMEVLFEQDNDQMSVATMVLDAIVKCPVDMRKPLAENILLIGGTVMCPGFKARLEKELKYLVQTPKYSSKLALKTFKFHSPPAKENYVSWLGGSIFGATEMLQNRSLTKETYMKTKSVPDWANLAHNNGTLTASNDRSDIYSL